MKINSGQKIQPKYGSGAGSGSGVYPPQPKWAQVWQVGPEPEPQWTINSGQKVQPKYGYEAGCGSSVDPHNISSGET